jgi:hypothetical protein
MKIFPDFSPSAFTTADSPGSALLKGSGTALRLFRSNKKLRREKDTRPPLNIFS